MWMLAETCEHKKRSTVMKLDISTVPIEEQNNFRGCSWTQISLFHCNFGRLHLKCDGTRAETKFRLSTKRTSPFKPSVGVSSVDYWQPRCAPSAVVMLDTPCSEVVWRVLAIHSISQFPLHFPSRASPCAVRFQIDCTTWLNHALKVTQWNLPITELNETCL